MILTLVLAKSDELVTIRSRALGIAPQGPAEALKTPCGAAQTPKSGYGVNLLIRVDQLPIAARVPIPPGVPAQVPSRLSPDPPLKKGPPQVV